MPALIAAAAPTGLHTLDWLILGLYAAATIGMGWYVGRRQTNQRQYFFGSGQMNPLLIGVSLFATLLSTISYLSFPGEMVGKGPVALLAYATLPIVYVIVAYGIIPAFMKHRAISAYGLLEERLGLAARLLGASMFIALRLVWMSLLTFVAAKAMAHMMGIGEENVPYIVLAVGAIAVVYTSIGGLQAVVITDFVQSVLLFGGAWIVIAKVTYDYGGLGWMPTQWHENWDHQPIFPSDLKTRVSWIGSIAMILIWNVATSGGDQTVIQRFMATKDVHAARRSLIAQYVTTIIVAMTLSLTGLSLLAYFEQNPASLQAVDFELQANADQVFPHYIAYHLPIGISGLVIAAMFAAAMSSLDSGVNSITAVVSDDFLARFEMEPQSDRSRLIFSRCLAFGIGGTVVLGSSLVGAVPGNIMAVTQKTVNLLVTPIFGLFLYALFIPFARPAGAIAGTVVGTITAALISFSGPIVSWLGNEYGVDPATFGVAWATVPGVDPNETVRVVTQDPISFQWIGPFALAANLLVGCSVSLALGGRRRSRRTVRRRHPDPPRECGDRQILANPRLLRRVYLHALLTSSCEHA